MGHFAKEALSSMRVSISTQAFESRPKMIEVVNDSAGMRRVLRSRSSDSRVLPGGRVAYRIKSRRAGRAKHRVMTPLELLARLAALVPPPRYPLVRYHGVLAPHAAWRREIVPRPPMAPTSRTGTVRSATDEKSCGL